MQPALFTIKLGFLMLLQSSSRNSMAASAGVQTQYPPDYLQNLCLCAMWLLLCAANVNFAIGIYTKSNQNQRYPLATASESNTVTRRMPGYTQKA